MQSASTLPEMSPLEAFKQRIETESPEPAKNITRIDGRRLRAGQLFAMRLASDPARKSLFCGLPTGYGKTKAAMLAFAQRYELDTADHLLYLVPSDNLRGSVEKDLHLLSGLTDAKVLRATMDRPVAVAREGRKVSQEDGVVAIVTTIQQAATSFAHIENVMETIGGRWMVVFDEAQNYEAPKRDAMPGPWTRAKRALESRSDVTFTLGMTGTVLRSDGKWSDFGKPDFEVPYGVAHEEKAIRGLRAHEIDYVIDVEVDGEIQSMKLSEIDDARRADGEGTSVDAWETAHNVRYFGRYITDIFDAARSKLSQIQGFEPRAAMMVFCMSVKHAKITCETINRFAGKGFAEWVGSSDVGEETRTPEENRAILQRFKEGKFQCLVQVNMASVGYDHPHVCVELWLNTISAPVYVMQGIGRALRITQKVDDAHIFYSPDHPAREMFKNLEAEMPPDDYDGDDVDDGPVGGGGGGGVVKFPVWQILNARRSEVVIHTALGSYNVESEEDAKDLAAAMQARTSLLTSDQIEAEVARIFQDAKERDEASANELSLKERTAQAQANVKSALSAVVRTLARKTGMRQDPTWYGAMYTRLHRQYLREHPGSVSQTDMTEDQLRAKHSWLEQLHAEIKDSPVARIPQWLR